MNASSTARTDNGRGLLNIAEAADRLRCSASTVRRLVRSGRLPCVRLTRSRTEPLRFRAVDVARLIEEGVDTSASSLPDSPANP